MTHAIVVGAGLAGLIASIKLAKAGVQVRLLDGSEPGGRARSQALKGQTFNLGPHALYLSGPLRKILRQWGVAHPGADPTRLPSTLSTAQGLLPLPGSVGALLTHPVLAGARVASLAKLALRPKPMSVQSWLQDLPDSPRAFFQTLIRLSTYCPDPDSLSAPAAFDQLRLAQGGVRYLDGGWQGVSDALLRLAHQEGVILLRERATQVQAGQVRTLAQTHSADEVIVATPAPTAQKLTGLTLPHAAVHAACLCLGFAQRPEGPSFCLGLEQPTYAAVHSDSARLGPGAVLHLMRYGAGSREALLAWGRRLYPALDQAQTQRWLPALPVSYGLLRHGHPRPAVRQAPGLLLAGDWVGERSMLADASAQSALLAADQVLSARRGAA